MGDLIFGRGLLLRTKNGGVGISEVQRRYQSAEDMIWLKIQLPVEEEGGRQAGG